MIRHPAAIILFTAISFATPSFAGDDVEEMFQQAQRIQEKAKTEPMPEWLKGGSITGKERTQIEEISQQAREITEKAITTQLAESGMIPGPAKKGERIEILVSFSLGEAALHEILQDIAAEPQAAAVFRGLPPGAGMREGIAMIQSLAKDMNPPPRILIDPTRFRKRNTDQVPTLSIYDGDNLLISARGITGIRYLRSRLHSGAHGDLGALGPVEQASEPDLIDIMQQRLASLDLKKYADGARERYWDKITYTDLPQAKEARTRHIDPTVVVTADIKDANGKVLVPAGKRINPLNEVAFTQRLIVFDASRQNQVEFVQKLGQRYRDKRVTLIAARLDHAAGWDGFRKLQDTLHGPVYVLTPDVQSRFQIERLPSVVESNGKEFVVHEIPPQDDTVKVGSK